MDITAALSLLTQSFTSHEHWWKNAHRPEGKEKIKRNRADHVGICDRLGVALTARLYFTFCSIVGVRQAKMSAAAPGAAQFGSDRAWGRSTKAWSSIFLFCFFVVVIAALPPVSRWEKRKNNGSISCNCAVHHVCMRLQSQPGMQDTLSDPRALLHIFHNRTSTCPVCQSI